MARTGKQMAALAKEHRTSLSCRSAAPWRSWLDLTEKIKAQGVEDLVLDPGSPTT